MRPSLAEQETIVRIEPLCGEAIVYTSEAHMLDRLRKLGELDDTEWRKIAQETSEGDIVSETYTCPKDFIQFRKKRRVLTEAQKQTAIENLKKGQRHE